MSAQQCQAFTFLVLQGPYHHDVTMASRMYLVGLNITFLESGTCVSFTLTGEHSPNVKPQIFCLLHICMHICIWLSFCPPCLLLRWGKVEVSVWEAITWHSDNDLQGKSPENRNETSSWLCLWERVETKVFAFHKHQRAKCPLPARKWRSPQRTPVYLNPRCMGDVYVLRKPPGN